MWRLKRRGILITRPRKGEYCRMLISSMWTSNLPILFTGKDNRLILTNIERLLQNGKIPAVLRIPLIPGVTATRGNLFNIADFLREVNVAEAVLLPFNPLGLEKWPRIGKSKPDLPQRFMSEDEIKELNRLFSSRLKRPVGEPYWSLIVDEFKKESS